MKRTIYFLAACFILLFIYSCKKNGPASSEIDNLIFYHNSFESSIDTSGWIGLTKEMFAENPCPGKGKKSIHLGGGCVQPAASIEFKSVKEGDYQLNFWAKMGQLSQSAQVKLKISGQSGDSRSLIIRIDSTNWKFYQSENRLRVNANENLKLEIWVGGIIFADVFIDELKIERREPTPLTASIYKNIINAFK